MGVDISSLRVSGNFSFLVITQDVSGGHDEADGQLQAVYTPPATRAYDVAPKPVDPWAINTEGDTYFSTNGQTWTYKGNNDEGSRYVALATGSGATAGYQYMLRNDGKVYFTDRGTDGWNQYGYGLPDAPTNTSYVDICCGAGTTAGYVYVMRSDGKVYFTDRGTNGWNQYGYGAPLIPGSTAYVSLASGASKTSAS